MSKELSAIRRDIIEMGYRAKTSHTASSLSVVDILWTIYEVKRPQDKVILSKGHASAALYAVLVAKGLMPREYLAGFDVNDGLLPKHVDMTVSDSIDASAGSLGHGASIGLGMAIADSSRNVYVVMGDGEMGEGAVWEAIAYSGANKIKNLKLIIDHNGLQILGSTKDTHGDNFVGKLRAFGHDSVEVDGHDPDSLTAALKGPATAVIARTIKGKGASFMENRLEWHGKFPTDEQYVAVMKELENAQ